VTRSFQVLFGRLFAAAAASVLASILKYFFFLRFRKTQRTRAAPLLTNVT
jgi:hypothetical protein